MKITIDCPHNTVNDAPQMAGWVPRETTIDQLRLGVWVPLHCDPERGGCDREGMAFVRLKGERLEIRHYKLEEF